MINSNKGISIIEVLVVMSLVALIASFSAGFVVSQKQQARLMQMREVMELYEDSIGSILSLNSTCSKLLPNSGSYSGSGGVLNLTQIKGSNYFENIFYDDVFYISSAMLRYNTLDSQYFQFIDSTYQYGAGPEKELLGEMTLVLRMKDDIFNSNKSIFQAIKTKRIVIPIKMYVEAKNTSTPRSWKNVSCAAEDSEDIIFKAQICNLYGGSLTDGAHCDFPRVLRTHSENLALNPTAIPVAKISQDGNNKVQRVRLGDIACYIDSLVLITQDVASVQGSGKKVTSYCRHPGGAIESHISIDAQKFFQ